jgi:hypothetical protein
VRSTNRFGRSVISRRIAPKSPEAACRPATTTSIRRATCSTSSRMCELKSTVRPSAPIRRSSSIRCIRWRGSIPLNGSSSSSTAGSCTSDDAILIRCRMPLEYVEIERSCASLISTSPIDHSAAAPGACSPCSSALATTNCRPVR